MSAPFYELVETDEQLESAINVIQKAPSIAVDLEFDKNRYRYGFNLCLLQIATSNSCFLIDPLSMEVGVSKVFPFLEDPSLAKLVFEFGEDRKLLATLGCMPKNVQDLSIAAKLLDYPQLSLVNLLREELGVETSKGSQMSNWFRRPLSEAQCTYAAEDVIHLHELQKRFMERFSSCADDRLKWYYAENEFLENNEQLNQNEKPTPNLHRDDRDELDQVAYHVLKRLHEFRNKVAQEVNRPEYQVCPPEQLMDIAKGKNRSVAVRDAHIGLKSLRSPAFKKRLLKAVEEAEREAGQRGLSSEVLAFTAISKEEKKQIREEKRIMNEEIEKVWKPVQRSIREKYGENVATFLISNRVMKALANDEVDSIAPYRMQLFEQIKG